SGSFTVTGTATSERHSSLAASGFTRPKSPTSTATVCLMFSTSRTTGKRLVWTYGCRCAAPDSGRGTWSAGVPNAPPYAHPPTRVVRGGTPAAQRSGTQIRHETSNVPEAGNSWARSHHSRSGYLRAMRIRPSEHGARAHRCATAWSHLDARARDGGL